MDIRCQNLVDRRGRDVHSDRHRGGDSTVRAIVLHQTTGRTFLDERNQEWLRGRGAHRVDRISAHFVVLQNGMIYYTHDITEYRAGSAGREHGIDIEFAGNFPAGRVPDSSRRVPRAMIAAGRALIKALVQQANRITHIHPHGQVQGQQRVDGSVCGGRESENPCGSLGNCPGPDIWVNIGQWAVEEEELNLTAEPPLAGLGYPQRNIDPQQLNPAYRLDGV